MFQRKYNFILLMVCVLMLIVVTACADDGDDELETVDADTTSAPVDEFPDAPMVVDAPGDDPIDEDQLVPGNDAQPITSPELEDPTFTVSADTLAEDLTFSTETSTVFHRFEEPEEVTSAVSGSPSADFVGVHTLTFINGEQQFDLRFSDNVIEGLNIPVVPEDPDGVSLFISGVLLLPDESYTVTTDAELMLDTLSETVLTGSFTVMLEGDVEVSGEFANVRFNTGPDDLSDVDPNAEPAEFGD